MIITAEQTSWQPLQKNGKPLTHMILKSIEGSLEFHLSILYRLFYASFILFGFTLLFYATYSLLSYHFQDTLWSVFLGFIFTGVGIYMFSKQAIPLVFNKKKNIYFKENENLEIEDKISLDKIQALQVLSYVEKDKEQTELNLILNDGKRIYLCTYDDERSKKIEEDANKISKYIERPIWK